MPIFTNSFKSLPVIAFGIWVALTAASSAQAPQTAQKQLPGKIVIANVVNKVESVSPTQLSPRSLKKNDVINEDHTVISDTASTATLVFSNGATVSVLEKSSLVITEFLQDPFAVPFAMTGETEEPTTSTTKLNLKNGEVVCKVKKLRIDKGSALSIETPVGAAGVRGTTFATTYLPNQNGTDQGSFTLSVTEGEVVFTDKDGNVTVVTAGKEVVVTFTSSTDPVTGETTITEILSTRVQDIPADRQNRINQVAEKGEADADTVVFETTDNLQDIMQFPDIKFTPTDPNPVTDPNPEPN